MLLIRKCENIGLGETKMTQNKRQQITIRIDTEKLDSLKRITRDKNQKEQTDIEYSELIREAINTYLEQYKKG